MQRRIFKTLIIILSGFALEAQAMSYRAGAGFEVALEGHCQEKGYVRPINPIRQQCTQKKRILGIPYRVSLAKCEPQFIEEIFLKKPIALVETLNLGNGRIFHRILHPKQSYYELPQCEVSLIEKEHRVFMIRQPTLQEKFVYKALHQQGITLIDAEREELNYLKSEALTENGGPGDNPLIKPTTLEFKTPYCDDGRGIDTIGTYYQDLGDYLRGGGEGSGSGRFGAPNDSDGGGEGSGSGKITLTLNIPVPQFNDLRIKANWFERLIKVRPTFYKYLVEGKKIPNRIIKVKCEHAND